MAAGGHARDDAEHEDVHRGIGDRGDPAQQRQRVVVRVGGDQVDPQQRRERERDDQRVDQAAAVAVLVAFADQQQHAGDEEGVEGEVERVGDRGKRQAPAEEAFVVVGEDVAGDEQGLPDREQIPGQAAGPELLRAPMISAATLAPPIRLKTSPLLSHAGPKRART